MRGKGEKRGHDEKPHHFVLNSEVVLLHLTPSFPNSFTCNKCMPDCVDKKREEADAARQKLKQQEK
jgi:hypothetical protein